LNSLNKKISQASPLLAKENISNKFIKIPTSCTSFPKHYQKTGMSIGCVKMVIPPCSVAALLNSLHQAGVLHNQAEQSTPAYIYSWIAAYISLMRILHAPLKTS